ncbi:MAG: hypothetical protein RL572_190 [Pseudomonadota bacterium]
MTPRLRPRPDRSKYIFLRPRSAKMISLIAIGCLYGWFALKCLPIVDQPAVQITVGVLGLLGVISAILMFLCTYSFMANAPDEYLDEREIQERNAAYLQSYIYAMAMLLVGYIASDIVGRVYAGFTVTPEVVSNFLTLALFTGLIMPTTVLAWRDCEADDS